MTFGLLAALLGLALLDSLSPATIIVTIVVVLTAGRRSWLLLLIYWGTIMAAYFALGVVLMLGLGAVFAVIDETVGLWVQGLVGAAMLVGSFFIKPRKPRTQPRALQVLTPRGLLVLGLGTWGLEAATAVPYFAAIAALTSSGLPALQWTAALAGYVMIMMFPGVAIALVWTLLGERLRPRLERWLDKLRSSSGAAAGWLIGIVGFFVLQDAGWRLAVIYGLLGDLSLGGP